MIENGGVLPPLEIQLFAFFSSFSQIMYNGQPITKMACGAEFSMIMDCKGNLYSFGCPEYGQLGMATFWDVFLKVWGIGNIPCLSFPSCEMGSELM